MFWRISQSLERYLRNELPRYVAPENILEFGPGRSTRVLAETFPKATITSLEHQAVYYLKQKQKLQDLPQVSVLHSPLDQSLFYTAGAWSAGQYDLILVDGPPKATQPKARSGASRMFGNLNPGAIVILDDSHRPDEKAIIQQWMSDHHLTQLFQGGSFTVLQSSVLQHHASHHEAVLAGHA